MKLSPAMQWFLNELLEAFGSAGFGPLILRNYETLPNEVGNDLDVFVLPEHCRAAEMQLMDLARKMGVEVRHRHARSYFTAIWMKFRDSDEILHLDLYPGATVWHGLPFLDASELEREARTCRVCRIPRPAHEAMISSLASWLWGGFFKDKYLPRIRGLLVDPSEKQVFFRLLDNSFGPELGHRIGEQIVHGNPILNARKLAPSLRRRLWLNCLRRDALGTLKAWGRHWFHEIECWFEPPGCFIRFPRFEDPDGCLADAIRLRVGCYFGGVHVMAGASSWLERWRIRRLIAKNHLVIRIGDECHVNDHEIAFSSTSEVVKQIEQRVTDLLRARIISE